MDHRIRAQIEEACGPLNRYYCSLSSGYPVTDREALLCYFIRSGGAADFAIRYRQAMGDNNRWYCAEYYGYKVTDPEMLWDYYNDRSRLRRPATSLQHT